MSTDGGGWHLAVWAASDHHRNGSSLNPSSLGDFNTHAKLSDNEIRFLALSGQREAMVKGTGSTYIFRYGISEWNSFDSSGWQNVEYDAKDSSGNWNFDTCNGHYNNRGFSTYSDSGGHHCSVVYDGATSYMTTWHTHEYSGGCCAGDFGVYIR